jgi:S1-C subfamily serine protease
VRQGWLGVSLVPIESGVLVAHLEPDGPGTRAGLLVGDVIVGLDGEPIAGPGALREALRGKAGVGVELSLVRAGQANNLRLTPADRPN